MISLNCTLKKVMASPSFSATDHSSITEVSESLVTSGLDGGTSLGGPAHKGGNFSMTEYRIREFG